MARHEPDATRNVSVVPELPENKKKKRTAEEVTHSACTGWSRTARVAGGAPSLAAFVQRASLAAERCHASESPPRCRFNGTTVVADRRPCVTFLQTQRRRGLKCFLPPPATTEAKISCDFFWASRRHVRWPCVHYGILATASPSIGGDTAAILLTGLSANLWKSELQTVMSDTGAAQKTICIATKKKRNEHLRETAPSTCWAARVLAQATPPRC